MKNLNEKLSNLKFTGKQFLGVILGVFILTFVIAGFFGEKKAKKQAEKKVVQVEQQKLIANKDTSISQKLVSIKNYNFKNDSRVTNISFSKEDGNLATIIFVDNEIYTARSFIKDVYKRFVKFGNSIENIPGIDQVEIVGKTTFKDDKGNATTENAIIISMKMKEFKTIKRADTPNVYATINKYSDTYFTHPNVNVLPSDLQYVSGLEN